MTDSVYVVRLIDCQGGSQGVGADHQAAVLATLRNWFGAVCQAAGGHGTTWTLDLQWQAGAGAGAASGDAGSAATVNMRLFFVPSTRHSVIRLRAPWQDAALPPESDTTAQGYTVFQFTPPGAAPDDRQGTIGISEIYTNRCTRSRSAATQLELARTAFHEAMHNQLLRADNELHSHGGIGAATPVATSPAPADTRRMAGAIGRLVPQWTEGYRSYRDTYALDGL